MSLNKKIVIFLSKPKRERRIIMAIKVMGVAAGRKDSNSEILLKEALIACEEAGAEVTMINLRDYNLMDCIACHRERM